MFPELIREIGHLQHEIKIADRDLVHVVDIVPHNVSIKFCTVVFLLNALLCLFSSRDVPEHR